MRLHSMDAKQKRIEEDENGERFQGFDGVLEKDEEEQEADENHGGGGYIQILSKISCWKIVRSDELTFENLVLVEWNVGY